MVWPEENISNSSSLKYYKIIFYNVAIYYNIKIKLRYIYCILFTTFYVYFNIIRYVLF